MFSKIHRLSLKNEFIDLKKRGRWLSFSLFDILYSVFPDTKQIKLSVVVGKKVSLLSATRHRIKRLLTESLQGQINNLPVGLKMAVFAKKEILGKSFWEIKREIEKTTAILNKQISK